MNQDCWDVCARDHSAKPRGSPLPRRANPVLRLDLTPASPHTYLGVLLFVTPWTVARQAPLSMGILKARMLEWDAMLSSRGSSRPRDQTHVLGLLHWQAHAAATAAKSLQSCPTLCDSIDSSPPGFPVPGILQARTLEWVAISFSNA